MTTDNSYDLIPYSAKPFPQTHPDRLATIATLFGLSPPPVDSCKVLEIGCARGGNLMPMAEQLPRCQLLGIDLSAVQIKEAQFVSQSLNISNIEFRNMDILKFSLHEKYDYILCHGVYSWVPPNVQDRILKICSDCLVDNGIAFISYNVYPGWRMRGMLRDMMCYHVAGQPDAKSKIQHSRQLLDFMAKYSLENQPYGAFLRSEVAALRGHEDAYLFHEHLEEHNEPIYFYEFMHAASKHSLTYLGESDIASMYLGFLQPDIQRTLEAMSSDWVQVEQYLDFLRNRMFRQTLLCKAGANIDRELKLGNLERLVISGRIRPLAKQTDLRSSEPLKFQSLRNGKTVTANVPLMKAVLFIVAKSWPQRVVFSELHQKAYSLLLETAISATRYEDDRKQLSKTIYELYLGGLIELHTIAAACTALSGEKPLVSRYARHQSLTENTVTNLCHDLISIDEITKHLLPLLDGTRSRQELSSYLMGMLENGVLRLPGSSPQGQDQLFAKAVEILDSSIRQIALNCLLMPD